MADKTTQAKTCEMCATVSQDKLNPVKIMHSQNGRDYFFICFACDTCNNNINEVRERIFSLLGEVNKV